MQEHRFKDLWPDIDEDKVILGDRFVKWRDWLDTYLSYNEPIIIREPTPRWPAFCAGMITAFIISLIIYFIII